MIELVTTLVYLLVTGIVGVITAAIIYARWDYGKLEKIKGVPKIVKPAFIGGSDIHVYEKTVHDQDTANVKKYGKIYGYYEGCQPQIYIADPELIRLIFIKDFDHFHNRRIMDFGHELINEMITILPYDKWKVVRQFISPTMTTGKIRSMSIAMSETIEDWIKTVIVKHENKEPFNPKRLYTALTSDVIARCGFGTKVNCLDNPNNVFMKNVRLMALEDVEINYMLTVSLTFPILSRLSPFLPIEALNFFNDLIKSVMKTRRENNIKINDFVDTLNDMLAKLDTKEYKKLGITETTIMCQALFFLLAGFETSASTLTFITYNLATNPVVQEKLLEEVDSYLSRHDGKIEHETIGELTYMSACIQETLRMFPPVIRVERVCNKDWYHKPSGLHIPKDMVVQVPVYAIHHNEEYFPEPNTFKPERFLPQNKDKLNPNAFLGFGAGNHNCLGMRFAREEMHLALANVLRNFTFRPTADTKIQFMPGRTFFAAVEPFTVEAIKRSK